MKYRLIALLPLLLGLGTLLAAEVATRNGGTTSTSSVGGTPTVVTNTGAGPGSTISLTGNDNRFLVTYNVGTTPAATATNFTITFSAAFSTAPYVFFSPMNQDAAANGIRGYVTNVTATGFCFANGAISMLASKTALYNFWVVE